MRYIRRLHLLICLLTCLVQARAAVVEDVIEIPVSVKTIYNQEVSQNITVTIWRDDTRDKAPFLVLNHGRPATPADFARMGRQRYSANATYFVSKGFVVLVPTRIGYGPSGGPDAEYSGSCQGKMYPPAFKAAADQTVATLNYAKSLSFVDTSRGFIVGQSFGGATAIALASLNIEGVVAAVNFAGGGGGDPDKSPERPCRPDLLQRMFADYGKAAKVPTAWFYSENDRFWGKDLPKEWFNAFVASGGKGKFVQMPAYQRNGHSIFTGNLDAWKPAFEEFLKEIGF